MITATPKVIRATNPIATTMTDAVQTNADLIQLAQWLSPAFPLGSFAYSHGLEVSIAAGEVGDAANLKEWLSDILAQGAGRTDAILLACTLRGEDAGEMGALAQALAPTRERWEETYAQGSAFARTVSAMQPEEISAAAFPVALGAAARCLSLPLEQIISLYLHSFVSNLVSVAVRFVPLGQTDGQTVLASLHSEISALSSWAARAQISDLGSSAIRADLAAAQHETLNVRIFKT